MKKTDDDEMKREEKNRSREDKWFFGPKKSL